MYKTIDRYEFAQAFKDMGRGNSFSRSGLDVLFDYLEERELDCGTEELDVIALDCTWVELSPDEIRSDYDVPEDTEDLLEWLEYETFVAGETDCNTIVFMSF